MKKILLASLILCVMAFPSVSYAQVGFGSPFDVGRFPITCELPDFLSIPNCTPAVPAVPLPPKNFYDLFILLQIEGLGDIGSGFLAIPIALTLSPTISPSPVLAPGEQTLGTLLMGTPQTGGIFIPGIPATPYSPCIPSQCWPLAPAIGIVTPYTGAAPSGF